MEAKLSMSTPGPGGGWGGCLAQLEEGRSSTQLGYIQLCPHQVPRTFQGAQLAESLPVSPAPRPLHLVMSAWNAFIDLFAWMNYIHSAPCLLTSLSGYPLMPRREMCSGDSEILEIRGGCAVNPIPMKSTNQNRLNKRHQGSEV